ncbi:hypothetical protein WICPIJ_006065 [Wickerhamomyces pijperi]|uniref:Uncharacterized protein n=1 Tax=Wickerhamomyces pijperi TaxID=599730 RepID=A0A9P8Q2E1_WICPI|nr:hypothetical protein WICPIJ_006065 [Wickerhamomyces pijperi]
MMSCEEMEHGETDEEEEVEGVVVDGLKVKSIVDNEEFEEFEETEVFELEVEDEEDADEEDEKKKLDPCDGDDDAVVEVAGKNTGSGRLAETDIGLERIEKVLTLVKLLENLTCLELVLLPSIPCGSEFDLFNPGNLREDLSFFGNLGDAKVDEDDAVEGAEKSESIWKGGCKLMLLDTGGTVLLKESESQDDGKGGEAVGKKEIL